MIDCRGWLTAALRPKAVAALFIHLTVCSANSASAADVSDWDSVIAAAKAEGSVVLYTAFLGALQPKPSPKRLS